ncbi:flavin reductase family protein [Phyllobacterium sp. LjRoot231]|uniref:flavin reductase family protein n=1 Tax=Phyllobacterium sp. LjRoot231 TaxID=3342289 RepID=UPI003ED107A8
MSVEIQESFRQSMRRLASTVSVISCQNEGVRYGITVTAVTSLCFEPLSVLTCINSTSSIIMPLLKEGRFCINLLQNSQSEISQRFSGKAKGEERFEFGDWHSAEDSIPYLAGAQANLFCDVDQVVHYSTHRIVIGRVKDAKFEQDVAPLIYQNGRYATSVPMQAA